MKWYTLLLVAFFAFVAYVAFIWLVDVGTWSCGEVVDGVMKHCAGPSA